MSKYLFISAIIAIALSSCGENQRDDGGSMATEWLDYVQISRQPRAMAPGMESLEVGEAEAIVVDNSIFSPGSILYISQMGNDNTKNPNFTNDSPDASPYLYQYTYYENEEADWDNEYNFSNAPGHTPIVWQTVKELGSVGNSFSFFAMFFPESPSPVFQVNADQTGGDEDPYDQTNFMQSDILGAYHATSGLYTRMRFRLFHLMTYLKVTLYVPVYQDAIEGDNQSYSGFKAGALQEAYLLGAATDFSIEWRANRSSDTEAPLVQRGNTLQPIKMYMHESPTEDEPVYIVVKDYYPNPQSDTDEVMAYNFSVLFPQPSALSNDEITLCFPIESIDGNVKYYYFSASQVMQDTGNVKFSQGTMQQLYLYLPRTVNETILIGAKVLPWGQSDSDMTVFEEGVTFED